MRKNKPWNKTSYLPNAKLRKEVIQSTINKIKRPKKKSILDTDPYKAAKSKLSIDNINELRARLTATRDKETQDKLDAYSISFWGQIRKHFNTDEYKNWKKEAEKRGDAYLPDENFTYKKIEDLRKLLPENPDMNNLYNRTVWAKITNLARKLFVENKMTLPEIQAREEFYNIRDKSILEGIKNVKAFEHLDDDQKLTKAWDLIREALAKRGMNYNSDQVILEFMHGSAPEFVTENASLNMDVLKDYMDRYAGDVVISSEALDNLKMSDHIINPQVKKDKDRYDYLMNDNTNFLEDDELLSKEEFRRIYGLYNTPLETRMNIIKMFPVSGEVKVAKETMDTVKGLLGPSISRYFTGEQIYTILRQASSDLRSLDRNELTKNLYTVLQSQYNNILQSKSYATNDADILELMREADEKSSGGLNA